MLRWLMRIVVLAIIAAGIASAWWALQPRPVAADLVRISRGPMAVTIEEDGATRVRDIFRISAPVAGKVTRALLEVGDPVRKGETVIARIAPTAPPFMDARSRAAAEARVAAAEAAVRLAEAEAKQARAALALAIADYQRALRLSTSATISVSRLEAARVERDLKRAAADRADALVALRRAELASAKAALIGPAEADAQAASEECCVEITAPADGVVLSIAVKSETVVPAGALLAEIGDPQNLEVVADLLSTDAVAVAPGMKAELRDWGGPPLPARVRRVDPAGFVKVSALGIEERRVNVVLDPEQVEPQLGHDYQLRVAITVWEADDVLRVPVTALFREARQWAVFVVEDGIAHRRAVEIGHMNGEVAEVLRGLHGGEVVVDFPGDAVTDGAHVVARN